MDTVHTAATTRSPSPAVDARSLDDRHSAEHPSSEKSLGHAFSDKAPSQDGEAIPTMEYPQGAKFYLIMVSIVLTILLVSLDQTIVSTAIPEVSNQFNSFSDVGWYGSAYLLTSTCFQPLFGRLYSRFPIKWVFIAALTIFELGSLICGVAQDSTTFIVGRAVAGVGMSGAYSGTMIIVTLISPVQMRPVLMSVVGGAYGTGACIGPIVGGAFTSQTTWRWCFYINLCFYPFVAVAILAFLKVPNRPQTKSIINRFVTIDWLGVALSMCSVICLLLALQWGGIRYEWSNSKVIGLLVGFFVIALAFAVEQWYLGDNAIIPFRLHRQRTVGFGSLVNFCIAASYFGLLYFVPIYFQSVRGSSAIRSGVQTLPFVVAVIVATTLSGGLITKFGYYIPLLLVGTAITAVGSGCLYLLRPDSSLSMYVGLQFLAGVGPGIAFMIPFSAVSAALDPSDIEIGSAIVTFWQTLGGTLFVSVCQAIFQNEFVKSLGAIPGAPTEAIVAHGVSAFRAFTPSSILPQVELAANLAVNKTYLASVALGVAAFLAVFGMELNKRILPADQQARADTEKDAA
ncbi:MFS general substrate transporter [Moesziomyces antarcticus]|uniref:MFS general substrate transporter n=2 Tax=Pseudozyma antarctica TaxID=84753 RepID=A0A081CKU6_PSEA2|nr:MFS general substrate transporter [Moesziomyces antarcticus]GAK67292.1 MFS general substrate transporter [Moesziomyces antarcticus]SPO48096.1 probable aflatoxin efflux pump AFLT [Moesziomyces antarcticus]